MSEAHRVVSLGRGVLIVGALSAIFITPAYAHAGELNSISQVVHAGHTIHDGDTVYRSDFSGPNSYWTFNFSWPYAVENSRAFFAIAKGTYGNLTGGTPQNGSNFVVNYQDWQTGENSIPKSMGFALGDTYMPSGTYTVIVAYAAWDYYTDQTMQWFASGGTEGNAPSDYAFLTFEYVAGDRPPPVATCCASVAFIPGLEGSILKEGSNTLWPPSIFSNDLDRLEMNPDGTSLNTITVGGLLNTFYGTPIYQDFSDFMDEMVASTTAHVHEWRALPYDWRYGPEQVVANAGMVAAIEDLAAHSTDGKVSIVAHSMGGLVGKALIKALVDKGEGDLVESFVMVGTPQLGTPQAVASILHGDGQGVAAGLIVRRADARGIAQNMPSAYDLLPSREYFERVADPVIVFSPSANFTVVWRAFWGDTISKYLDFASFMTGSDVPRVKPIFGTLSTPEVISPTLLADADAMHTSYDTFTFPASMRVVQVAGWGLPTVKGVLYQNEHLFPNYRVLSTREGDKTVVYPSAISTISEESFYFNLLNYNKDLNNNNQHRDLLNTLPIQNIIQDVVQKINVSVDNYISIDKPTPANLSDQLLVSTHSPVVLGAYDSNGNYTGVNPNQDPNAAVWLTSEDIPGSTFLTSGDSEYLFLPKDGTYNFVFNAIGTGSTTVAVQSSVADVTTDVSSYSDIPIAVGAIGTFTIDNGTTQNVSVAIDSNGDGQVETYVVPDGTAISLDQLLTNLTIAVQDLTIKASLKTQLLNKIAAIQKKIAKQRQKQSTVLASLQVQVAKNAAKGKIDAATAAQVGTLLDGLIAQSATIPLDPTLISQLQAQITIVPISALKTSLLNKINQLQNLAAVTKSLATFTKTITTKGSKDQIPDADVQNILSILDSINSQL